MTVLYTKALELFKTAIAAADPARAVNRALRSTPLPDPSGRLLLIAIGKAAPAMMGEALKHVRGACEGLIVTHYENAKDVPGADFFRAAHPVPDAQGLKAGQQILARLDALGEDDAVVVLVSGGGSALVPAPVQGLTLDDKIAVNTCLLASGLDIVQMNLVRQHLSQLKGGGLVRRAAPAPVTGYVLSDVIGDDLRAIASGPTVAPIGTPEDAIGVLEDAGIWDNLPETVRAHLTGISEIPSTPRAENHLVGSNRMSLDAMLGKATGFDARIVSDDVTGDVEEAARRLFEAARAAPADRPVALLFGGETTVSLKGTGRGGRNQELALRFARHAADSRLPGDWVFLSGGTDGRDGPTDAAGGIVDAQTVPSIGSELEALLDNNDSYEALRRAGALLITGATGTNVADVQVFLSVPTS